MSSHEHQRLKQAFATVRATPSAQREAFLLEHYGHDAQLLRELRSLLAHDDERDTFTVFTSSSAPTPARIGEFRVLDVLGEGGMGVVYKAEQEHPHRTVALKVVRQGIASPRALRRFEHEAEILGRLQHPGIAQVYAAGRADSGEPFFAMELIDGERLDAFARSRKLSTRARLELFARVCDAVHHAHQKGVIHCDLKPGNILVDKEGQPKVLDFGVARATDCDLQITTMRTDMRQLMGTVPYMSPEQTSGDPERLDVRSDVYALGVLCYELLCERLPHDVVGKTVVDALRVIQEDEPTPLSAVNRVFSGDLATITSKALEKDKTRRYQSAQALADDVRRHLKDEPIAARPASAIYHLRKFARRHKAVFASVLSIFVVLVAGIVVTSVSLARTVRAESLATRSNDHLLRTLVGYDPMEVGGEVRMADVLLRAAKDIDQRFADAPEVLAKLQHAIGSSLLHFGRVRDAAPLLEGAVARATVTLGALDPFTLRFRLELASLRSVQGRYRDAQGDLERLVADTGRALGASAPETLLARANLGAVLEHQGLVGPAHEVLSDAQRTAERVLPDGDRVRLAIASGIASTLLTGGEALEAAPLLRATLAAQRQHLGTDHPETIGTALALVDATILLGKHDEARPLLDDLLTRVPRVLGPEHPSTRSSLLRLVHLSTRAHRLTEARQILEPLLARERKELGETDPEYLLALGYEAELLRAEAKYDEAKARARACHDAVRRLPDDRLTLFVTSAEVLSTTLLELQEAEPALAVVDEALARLGGRAMPRRHRDGLPLRANRAAALQMLGRLDEADEALRATLATTRESFGAENPSALHLETNLVSLLTMRGRVTEAVDAARATLAVQERVLGPDSPDTIRTAGLLSSRLRMLGELTEAEPLTRRVVDANHRVYGPEHPATRAAVLDLTKLLTEQRRFAEVETVLREALALEERLSGPDAPWTLRICGNLGHVIWMQGRLDEAEPWLRRPVQGLRATRGERGVEAVGAAALLGGLRIAKGEIAEAERIFKRVLTTADASDFGHRWEIACHRHEYGRCLFKLGRHDEAEMQLLRARDQLAATLGAEHARTRRVEQTLAELYERLGQPERAASRRSAAASRPQSSTR